jgi:hypothetical protein
MTRDGLGASAGRRGPHRSAVYGDALILDAESLEAAPHEFNLTPPGSDGTLCRRRAARPGRGRWIASCHRRARQHRRGGRLGRSRRQPWRRQRRFARAGGRHLEVTRAICSLPKVINSAIETAAEPSVVRPRLPVVIELAPRHVIARWSPRTGVRCPGRPGKHEFARGVDVGGLHVSGSAGGGCRAPTAGRRPAVQLSRRANRAGLSRTTAARTAGSN